MNRDEKEYKENKEMKACLLAKIGRQKPSKKIPTGRLRACWELETQITTNRQPLLRKQLLENRLRE